MGLATNYSVIIDPLLYVSTFMAGEPGCEAHLIRSLYLEGDGETRLYL